MVSSPAAQQAQERVDGFVAELFAVDLGGDQVADDVLGRLGPARFDLLEEVVLQRRRRFEGAFVFDGVADQFDRASVKHGQVVCRQTQQGGDDPGGKLEGELADQIGPAGVDELVDEGVADRPDDGGFPAGQGLGLERRGHQVAVVAVFFALHRQDGRPHEQADGGVVHRRTEHPAVTKRLVHRVEGHRREGPLGSQRLGGLE